MRHPELQYRGRRIAGGVVVCVGDRLLSPRASQRLHFHSDGFEWGYGGAGPTQLALAILLDALDDEGLARRWATAYMLAVVWCWGDTWQTTAADVRTWVARAIQHEIEQHAGVRRCRRCGCTDEDCRQCIAAQGYPCSWVEHEPNLCTRCAMELGAEAYDREGGVA